MFANRGHKVGCLLYCFVPVQGILKADNGRPVVFNEPEALRQRTVCARCLVQIAVSTKQFERALGKVSRQQTVRHLVCIDVFHGRQVIGNEPFGVLLRLQVLAHGLQGVGFPKGIMISQGGHIAAQEILKLLLHDVFLRSLRDDATRTDVIIVGQQLRSVSSYFAIGVYLLKCLNALSFQAHIIEIGGSNYIKL